MYRVRGWYVDGLVGLFAALMRCGHMNLGGGLVCGIDAMNHGVSYM